MYQQEFLQIVELILVSLVKGFSYCNGKEIAAKCHSIAKKIHEDIIRDAKEINNKKFYNE
jgi:hypothetical protein